MAFSAFLIYYMDEQMTPSQRVQTHFVWGKIQRLYRKVSYQAPIPAFRIKLCAYILRHSAALENKQIQCFATLLAK